MPLPLGHTAIGLAVLNTLAPQDTKASKGALFLYSMVLANLPDVDVLLGLFFQNNGAAFHRGPTHSLLFAVLAAVVARQAARCWRCIPTLDVTVCFILIFSHILSDMLLTTSPVSLLWPLELYWAPGYYGWKSVFDMVLFKSVQDVGIVVGVIGYLVLVRYVRQGRKAVFKLVKAMIRD